MQTYHLADEFTDVTAEQALLASLATAPTRYWELEDVLTAELFPTEAATWQALAVAFDAGQPAMVPPDWALAPDPAATAQRLRDLHQRRLLAAAQERLAQALFDETIPAPEIAALLEAEALRVQAALRDTEAGHLQWASALLPQVLADAEARRLQREATGSAVLGVPTGLAQFDHLLGGLTDGLYLLAGPPGMGKTTLALQIAAAATREVPVVVVTFEHAPENLTLKLLCARAGVNPRDVQRGYADLGKLRAAAEAWQPVAQRLAVVEGSSRLRWPRCGPRPAAPCGSIRPSAASWWWTISSSGRRSPRTCAASSPCGSAWTCWAAYCASWRWGCAARCWRWRRKTAAPATTAPARAARRWIRSRKAATWSTPPMWCCS